ncbi:MAG: phage holin family protein [Gemmatimonadales bacterium]|nr:phage holin family protein [Gemmatimonadales bacterium]
MKHLVLRWIIATAALLVAVSIVPGIHFSGEPIELFLVAAVFGLVNALLKPLVTLLTCPLVLLTLGLFGVVINAWMLLATANLAGDWGLPFAVDGFWSAFFGGILISLVSTALGSMLKEQARPPRGGGM